MTDPTPDPADRSAWADPEMITAEEVAQMLAALSEEAVRRWQTRLDARSEEAAGPDYAERWSRFPVAQDAEGMPVIWMWMDEDEWPAPYFKPRSADWTGKSIAPLLRDVLVRAGRDGQVWVIDLKGGSMAKQWMSDVAPPTPALSRSTLARLTGRIGTVQRACIDWFRRPGRNT